MRARKQTILVVDDDPLIRTQIALALGDKLNILLAANGIDAARQFEQHAGQVIAVITDLRMPRLNGVALTEWLHHINPRLPIVMMTAEEEVMKELGPLLRDPRVRLLLKPFDQETLKALLDETIKTNEEA
jgi:DNA-binding NtrC family response regulator